MHSYWTLSVGKCVSLGKKLNVILYLVLLSVTLQMIWIRTFHNRNHPVVRGFPKKTQSRYFRFAVTVLWKRINHCLKIVRHHLLKIPFGNRTESPLFFCSSPHLLFLQEVSSFLVTDTSAFVRYHQICSGEHWKDLDLVAKSTRTWLCKSPLALVHR